MLLIHMCRKLAGMVFMSLSIKGEMNTLKKLLSAGILCLSLSCGNTTNNTANDSTPPPDTAGGIAAPSSDKVDLPNTDVDSLRRTTDIKTDTTPAMKQGNK